MSEQQLTLPVEGMTCASCSSHVSRSLRKVPGVRDAQVNLATERAQITFTDKPVPLPQLVKAVEDAGYDVPEEAVILPIGGMTCTSCASHVEKALQGVPGVERVTVNLATANATVTYIPEIAGLDDFRRAFDATGYKVLALGIEDVDEEPVDREERKMQEARFRMQVAWAFTVPIILWMFADMFFGIVWP
ncbi:MAG: copper ion binding protein, partial [Caldilineales bacterium]|nr:copper ion binding protein [Caldilineales bacterium]